MTYIALLRGINVGGHNVKMERLRELFAGLGLARVRSYIQSGNIFFDAEAGGKADADFEAELSARIEATLRAELGYEVPVFLRSVAEIEAIIASDPFGALTLDEDLRFCITFCRNPLPADLPLPIVSAKADMEIIGTRGTEAFVVWHIINGRPPAASTVFDKVLGKITTTRFFHTTAKILEAAKEV